MKDSNGSLRRTAPRAGLAVLLICALVTLVLPAGANATVSTVEVTAGIMKVTGSLAPDHTTIRFKFNSKGEFIVEIYDPAGAPVLPPGCIRKDANTIQCPGQFLFDFFMEMGPGDDEVIFDFPFLASFLASPAPATTRVTADGGEGNDTLGAIGLYNDTQIGGAGNDTMMGGGGNDTQIGGPGNDTLSGQAGNDIQTGGPGNDKQQGGAGNDKLSCGGGDDKGVGGGGKDKAKGCEVGKP